MDMNWMKSVRQWTKDGVASLKTIKRDKAEYKEHLEKIKNLPRDYQIVYEEITKFLWQFAAGDGMDMVRLNQDLLDFFEEGVANNKAVLELVGHDVGAFAENTLHEYQAKTWIDSQKKKMNERIAKKIG